MSTTPLLIANNKSVLQTKIGIEIDKFENVVRFNNYEIEGYEEYIGSKTTFVFNRCTDDVKPRNVKELQGIFFLIPYCRYTGPMFNVAKQWQNYYKGGATILKPEEFSQLYEELGYHDTNNRWPSVGLLSIFYILKHYRKVLLHGFNHIGIPSHYFKKQPLDSKFHDWDKENAYLKGLEEAGKIEHF